MTTIDAPSLSGRRLVVVAAVLFTAITLPFYVWGRGERSAYVLTFTSYPISQGTFGLLGYSYTLGPEAIMAENTYYIDQTLAQNGAGQRSSLYFTSIRPLYAFAASLFAPIVGVIPALGLLNYLSWAAMALAAWRFTHLRTGDTLAAALASLMTAAGLGAAVHIHDYSPHLFPFAVYFLGVLLMYETRVWDMARPLKIHLLIGVFLALSSLAYSIGLVLAVAYILIAVRHSRWWHVAVGAALGLSSQYLWSAWLNVVQSVAVGRWTWTNVQGVEQLYMAQSLAQWRSLAATPTEFVARVWEGLLQFANFEFPPLVIAGVLCWLFLRRRFTERWFDAVLVSLPFAAGLVYLNRSTTRGYLVYGVSIVLYAVVAEAGARGWRRGRVPLRSVMVAVLAALWMGQLVWSSSYLWGYIVPAKIFFGFGYRDWIPTYLMQFQPPPAFSLTGAEPTPLLFGGGATLPEAGMYVEHQAPALTFSPLFAMVYRAPIVAYVCALIALGVSDRRRLLTGSTAIALWIVPAVLPRLSPPQLPPLFSTFYSLHVPAGSSWRYSVTVDQAFLERLKAENGAATVQFMVPGQHPPFRTTITTGDGVVLATADDGRAMLTALAPPADVVAAVARTRRIDVEITARVEGASAVSGVSVFGWQRQGLAGRRLHDATTGEPITRPTLPAFELRLLDSHSKLLIIGF